MPWPGSFSHASKEDPWRGHARECGLAYAWAPQILNCTEAPTQLFAFTHSHGPIFHLFSAAGERDHVPALPRGLSYFRINIPGCLALWWVQRKLQLLAQLNFLTPKNILFVIFCIVSRTRAPKPSVDAVSLLACFELLTYPRFFSLQKRVKFSREKKQPGSRICPNSQ